MVGILAVAIAALSAAGCEAQVTPDGAAYQTSSTAPGELTVTAGASTGANNREFLWSDSAPTEVDSTVCMQWTSGSSIAQEGAVLRATDVHGVVRGITIMRNIWMDDFQYINFHVWNTSDTANPFSMFGTVDLASYLGSAPVATYPLNFCARAIGNQAQFILWKQGSAEPAWGSTTQGGSATIPDGWEGAGQSGIYAGHILPGTSAVYSNITVDGNTTGSIGVE